MNFRYTLYLVTYVACLAVAGQSEAKVKVVTTTTDLAWTVEQIGGNLVDVKALLDGSENPHYVDAVPKYVHLVANADVVCLVGLDLEIGWMPKVLAKSGNAKVQPGGLGYCDASLGIDIIDKPTGPVDRSLGDVHPGGNPHYWLDPTVLGQSAKAMAAVLIGIDPDHSANYLKNLDAFTRRMQDLKVSISAKISPILKALPKGPHLVEYHSEFGYFLHAYGLKKLASIEEKPGVKPAAGRIATIAIQSKQSGVRLVIAAPYNSANTLQRFHELSNIPLFVAPTSLQVGDEDLDSVEKLQNHLADGIVSLLTKGTVAGG